MVKRDKDEIYFWILVIIVLRFLWYIYEQHATANQYKRVAEAGLETTGEIHRLIISEKLPSRGNTIVYKFEIDGETRYEFLNFFDRDTTFVYMTYDTTNIGRKFIVKYLPEDPKINVILLDREVK